MCLLALKNSDSNSEYTMRNKKDKFNMTSCHKRQKVKCHYSCKDMSFCFSMYISDFGFETSSDCRNMSCAHS